MITNTNKLQLSIVILVVLLTSFTACNTNKTDKSTNQKKSKTTISGDLIVFHAGSLSVPFKEIAKEFKKEYPEVNIKAEIAGSVACARKITDLKRPCDIMASADYAVIDKMLIPEYTDWNIKFASNEMVIAFTEKSGYKSEINKNNWYDILLKKDVNFGRSDPNSDPCGYRAVLTIKLAAKKYNKQDIVEEFLEKDTRFIRPKEVDLLALLETNTIDYIFIYRSVVEQHGLEYILLPDSINLKNPELKDYYSSVSVDINGKKPGEFFTQKGEPMVYGVTILNNAPNKKAALSFTKFLLSKNKGMKIMEKNGQPSLVPSFTSTFSNIPDELKEFAKAPK
ncbi:MAG: tungstate ABC transporter substrate-binding protein WtpA [Bacteroidales bacterium]|nr:tungstate ABC transporter substrate-binding protein WtpA [Bacteroidales bacterium]